MDIINTKIVPVSTQFRDTMYAVFPPLDVSGINKDTSMIDIQRASERNMILEFVDRAAIENTQYVPTTFMSRLKYVLFNHRS